MDYKKIFETIFESCSSVMQKIKNIQNINKFKRDKIKIISLTISILLTAWELYLSNDIHFSKGFIISCLVMIVSIYFIVYPFLYFFRPKFKVFLSTHSIFCIILIVYFITLIPILGAIDNMFLDVFLGDFVIKFLHIITILVSMSLIITIISKEFIMLVKRKKRVGAVDVLTAFLTYIVLGLAFGAFYYILNFMSGYDLFIGLRKPNDFKLDNFLDHLYVSFGSLTSVGSGNIYSTNAYMRLLCVFETLLGTFLTSFSLGFIFSALGTVQSAPEEEGTIVDKNILEMMIEAPKNRFRTYHLIVDYIKKIKLDIRLVEEYTPE